MAHDRIRPVFFFDQPTRRSRMKGSRSYMLNYRETDGGPQLEAATQSNPKEVQGWDQESDRRKLSDEPCDDDDDKLDVSPCVSAASNHCEPLDAYKRVAPQLLDELAHLLSQHKWSEEGGIPCGIANILNTSWDDLTAGASLHLGSPAPTDKQPKSKSSLNLEHDSPLQARDGAETERDPCVGRDDDTSEREPHIRSHVKSCKQNASGAAHSSTETCLSISACSCSDPGGLIQPELLPPNDEPQSIRLYQWVVERLQAARSPGNLPTPDRGQSKPLILRHYGNTKTKLITKRRKFKPQTLDTSAPQIPDMKLPDPDQQKLHYRTSDGSSCVYYPSGCLAVCQSHSDLPCGGFYTNVFSDGKHPVVIATITASGHGAVTPPHRSAITAVWDQDGGFLYDQHGNISKEWSWRTRRTNHILVNVSDQISVFLFSGIAASLSFRCDNQSVHLPLSAVSNQSQTKEALCSQTEKLTLDAARDLQLQQKKKGPAGVSERKMKQGQTPMSACSQADHMCREVEGQVEPSAAWRRQAHVGWELKRLQQRIRNIVEDWLDCYRVSIGIRCSGMECVPAVPLLTRSRKDLQKAALPSLNPPEPNDAKPEESRKDESQNIHGYLSAPAESSPDLLVKTPRSPKKRSKRPPVIRVGPIQIHGYIDPESVTLLNSPDSDTSLVDCRPANTLQFAPSIPLTVCPALLRAALQGEVQRRRCCCSDALMPVVTDLEYDALITGQPPHSQQILVVCVTPPRQLVHAHTESRVCAAEELYRRRNKHRTMPCTQCQVDSFRLLRYEMFPGMFSLGPKNVLLQHRHNAAPGMVLMYIRGKLLSVGFMSSDDSCSVWDLQRQISKSRRDYRLGVSLPSDYKFSNTIKSPAAMEACSPSEAAQQQETT